MSILSYFDSSALLAIILDEARKDESYQNWITSEVRCSSILLKIETEVSLRRSYERNKEKLGAGWLDSKMKLLEEYLNEVNYLYVDEEIEQRIYFEKQLAYCRALDAIHVATALEFRQMIDVSNVIIYTFDDRMKELSQVFHFLVNEKPA
jgi:predicted nucleic acid-binding protein